MNIVLHHLKPSYMSTQEVTPSDIYLQEKVTFNEGKHYLIRAQSGHGKTSLLNFLYGESYAYNGTIIYNGEEHPKNLFSYRRNKLSYLFQDLKLFPTLTAMENIQLKNRITSYFSKEQIDDLFEEIGLAHKRKALLSTLSLGQRQRIAFLRALAQPFEVLLLDEPFSHLDNANTMILKEILQRELSQRGASLLLTSLEANTLLNYDKVLNL